MLLQKKENYLDFIMKRGGKSRAVRKPADVPTSLLDAYTESGGPAQSSGMVSRFLDFINYYLFFVQSDSDRFKEGYTKKNKKKGRNDQQRKSESEKQPEPEPEVQVRFDPDLK